MRGFNLVAMLLSMAFFAMTQVLASPSPLDDYTIVDATWELHLTPGAPPTTFNGTIQQVTAQLAQRGLDWNQVTPKTSKRNALDGGFNKAWDWCGPGIKPYGSVFFDRIGEGINYLQNHNVPPSVPAGPKVCARISCSWRAAIHWCNDNDYSLSFSDNQPLIDGIHSLHHCAYFDQGVPLIVGQVFTKDNWNILIADDDC